MLSKLIKYDFKWINKVMYIYFVILFIITLLARLISFFEATFVLLLFEKIVIGIFIGICINIIVTCIIRIWGRFIVDFYKDESYLTHTLPVTKNELFNSKIIASILSLIMSIVVVFICFIFAYLDEDKLYVFKGMFESLVNLYGDAFAVVFILGLIILILFEAIYIMMSGIFGIICGHTSNNNRILKSIAIGLGSYLCLTGVSFIIIKILSSFINIDFVAEGFPEMNILKSLGMTFIFVYLIYNLLYYFSSKYIFNKGVNVD